MNLKKILAGVMTIVFSLNLIQITVNAEENTKKVSSDNVVAIENEKVEVSTSEDGANSSEVLVKVKDGTVYVLKTAGNGALYVAKAVGSGTLYVAKAAGNGLLTAGRCFFGSVFKIAGAIIGTVAGVVIGVGVGVGISLFGVRVVYDKIKDKVDIDSFMNNFNVRNAFESRSNRDYVDSF